MSTILIIANIIGYIGLLLLYLQTTLGSRHIFKYFTTDTVLVNRLHQYIGTYGMLFVFVHPVLEMISRLENLAWVFLPSFIVTNEIFVTFGRFALMLSLLVWVTSAIVREKIKWRPWKYIHLLAYPTLFFAFIHIPTLGSFFEDYIFVKIIWAALFFSFIIATIYRLGFWATYGKVKFKLIEERLVGDDIVIIKLQPIAKKLTSQIGQHFYLQTGAFKSEHPFTIMRNEEGILSFGIRRVGKFWDEILSKKLGETVYVDGPYGVFTKEAQNTDPKVIISAGVGVTPFVDLVDKFGENSIYFNCNRKAEEAIESNLLRSKSSEYFDILENTTNAEGAIVGRISKEILVAKLGDKLTNLPYFICGSPMFIKFIKQTLLDLKVPSKQIYFEELGF